MDLEAFLISMMLDITEASEKDENFDLHLEKEYVHEIATAYKNVQWIEIY